MGARAVAAVLTAAAACAGCGPFGDEVDGSLGPLGDAVESASRTNKPVRLAAVTDFAWDRVHAFPPYSSPEEIVRELGVDWGGADDSASRSDDSYSLLVFTKDGQVVRAFDHYVGDGDLACIEPPYVRGGLTPSEAVLRISDSRTDDSSAYHFVSLARPRDSAEARRTKRCVRTYS